MVSHDKSSSSPSTDIMMMSSRVMVEMISKYHASKSPVENRDDSSSSGQNSMSTPPSSKPLHFENTKLDMVICPTLKDMLCKSSFNPRAWAA